MIRWLAIVFLLPLFVYAEDETPAYWEYGVGLGYIRLEHYPGSDQFADLTLPFPTFQYRGKVLRADDRDGAHAYLLKSEKLIFEISGTGYTGLDSNQNSARKGMEDLPWLMALGPQLVYKATSKLDFSFGIFTAMTTDFKSTQFPGQIYQGKLRYVVEIPSSLEMRGHFFYNLKFATQGLQKIYYETNTYAAKQGLMSQDLSYYQSVRMGRARLYVGFSSNDYTNAANRESPLHLRNHTLTYLAGLTYTLGESERREVPEAETQGIINPYLKYD